MEKTVKAMKRVEEIKQRRQNEFYKQRMKVKKDQEHREAVQDLERNIDIIQSPMARLQEDITLPQIKVENKAKVKSIKTDSKKGNMEM